MNTPIQFGLPQIILILVAGIGVALIVSSASLGRRKVRFYDEERGRNVVMYKRRGFRPARALSGAVLILFGFSLLWLAFTAQTYMGLTGEIKVGQIKATNTNLTHTMSVDLTLYDTNGNTAPGTGTYIVAGDEWMMQGNILRFPSWMNIFGIHSGYKLTRLEGRFDDPNMERTSQHTVIVLNGGDDQFFKNAQQSAWSSPFVEAAYGSGVFLQADSKVYVLCASQTGLTAKPETKSC